MVWLQAALLPEQAYRPLLSPTACHSEESEQACLMQGQAHLMSHAMGYMGPPGCKMALTKASQDVVY